MTTILGALDLKNAAREAAGNWKRFHCFAWSRARDLDEPNKWTLIYTHHRDSRLLDQSNAAAIAKAMEPFTDGDDPDVVFESHAHWAVGHMDGFSLRVFANGRITDAFRAYHELTQRLADYPILDEEGYGRREYEATLQNLSLAAWKFSGVYTLPEGWQDEVYDWLSQNREHALENRDDQGGWPEADDLEAAFIALGYECAE